MARTMRQDQAPPRGWRPTQAVPEPVLNNPYDEPSKHWSYKEGVPNEIPQRRPASYWFRSERVAKNQGELFAEEERDELPLVNRLRDDVRRWRDSGYRGASAVTKDLLRHWASRDLPRPLFFCQREAVETVIYLLELAIPGRLGSTGFRNFELDAVNVQRLLAGERPDFEELSAEFLPTLIDPSPDPAVLPLRRLGCKMATGSGKTVVMAMLIAWAFCNRVRNPATRTYPNAVLICAPNLTVRKRLQVLRPDHPENYYEQFQIVPARYRDALGAGKVLVTNWHVLSPKSEHSEGGTTYQVVQKGEETPEAFARDRLGELATRAPILVLNDEGHHCWRPSVAAAAKKAARAAEKGLSHDEKVLLKEEVEEARVWLEGLDTINSSGLAGEGQPAILSAIDLSATPFYLAASGHPEGRPFPWLVSDFGLVDAIECGIVKVPRLPVEDDTGAKDDAGRPDPKYFRLWEHVKDELKSNEKIKGRPKPEAVYKHAEGALVTLASQWREQFKEARSSSVAEAAIPPVLIVVCGNTDLAEVFFEKISGERTVQVPREDGKGTEEQNVFGSSTILPELANREGATHTIRIDTKLLAKLQADDGQSKDEAVQVVREIIDTVGKPGTPGEQIRCVVSVSMLTEGWDANNVTHILGVRAFGSQLLCEQVVGRGLRRMSYLPDPESGLLPAEYVDVYGIPFSLIPFKGKAKSTEGPDPIVHHVYALDERADFEIRMPVVESYTYALRSSGIECDVSGLEGMTMSQEPTTVFLAPTRGYHDEPHRIKDDFVEQDRQEYYRTVRLQEILFRLARQVVEDLMDRSINAGSKEARFARHQLFPEVLWILRRYVKEKVQRAAGVDPKEIALEKHAKRLRERVREGITAAAARKDSPLLPVVSTYRPWVSTADVNYRTSRPVMRLTRSHLNLAMIGSSWEREAIGFLEELDAVEAYTPNDRNVGLAIPYEHDGQIHHYEPDFIIRLRGGDLLALEIKGKAGEVHDEDRVLAKNAAAKKWVTALNNAKRFGRWHFEVCRDLSKLRSTIDSHATPAADVRPFRIVDRSDTRPYADAVPLVPLRAAAGSWSEQQTIHGFADWADDWVTWEDHPSFTEDMFVARVQGDSMEPEIPADSYCLFRAVPGGTRQNRRLLVWHSGIDDPHTGGEYTVKVYTSEKIEDADTGFWRTRIVLKPLNPAYRPIVLTPADEGEVLALAEVVGVLGEGRS